MTEAAPCVPKLARRFREVSIFNLFFHEKQAGVWLWPLSKEKHEILSLCQESFGNRRQTAKVAPCETLQF